MYLMLQQHFNNYLNICCYIYELNMLECHHSPTTLKRLGTIRP